MTVRESIQYYSWLFSGKTIDFNGLIELANLKDKSRRAVQEPLQRIRSSADFNGLIELANLKDKSREQFKNLSGGLKQRLGIAIALVNDPEVVFLDEPTTGLDPRARREVWEILLGLKQKGKTIFLTTHYMEEAELLADTVAIISEGRIIAIGSPDELIENNANELSLTMRSVDANVFTIVREMGFEPVRHNPDHIKVRVKLADDVRKILDAVKDAGASLLSLDVRKPNLEEVFLKLTGKVLYEGPAEGAPK